MLKQDLDEIKKLRKLVDELVSEAEHKQITDAVLKLKHDGISPETWVMLGIDHGQIFLMRKIYWQICENSALKSQLAAALKDLQTERERIVKLLDELPWSEGTYILRCRRSCDDCEKTDRCPNYQYKQIVKPQILGLEGK